MFDVQGKTGVTLIAAVSAANTAAATSAWVAIPTGWAGDIEFIQATGSVTGTIAGALQTADDGSGTNAAAVTFNESQITSVAAGASNVQKRSVDRKTLSSYVKYTGTIVTGPALTSVSMWGRTQEI